MPPIHDHHVVHGVCHQHLCCEVLERRRATCEHLERMPADRHAQQTEVRQQPSRVHVSDAASHAFRLNVASTRLRLAWRALPIGWNSRRTLSASVARDWDVGPSTSFPQCLRAAGTPLIAGGNCRGGGGGGGGADVWVGDFALAPTCRLCVVPAAPSPRRRPKAARALSPLPSIRGG